MCGIVKVLSNPAELAIVQGTLLVARGLSAEVTAEGVEKQKVVICGAGIGGLAAALACQRAGWQVRGLDFDPVAVAVARAKGLDVLEGTIDLLSDESACYDRITLSHVLEHAYDPWNILTACYRLLKPGGVLWLYDCVC